MDARTRSALERVLTMAVSTLRHRPTPSGREIALRNDELDAVAIVRKFLDAPAAVTPEEILTVLSGERTAKTREAIETLAQQFAEFEPDPVLAAAVGPARLLRIQCREAARRLRALLAEPAEAPLRGEWYCEPYAEMRHYDDESEDDVANPWGLMVHDADGHRWCLSQHPTREDAERVAAALRAVLARLET